MNITTESCEPDHNWKGYYIKDMMSHALQRRTFKLVTQKCQSTLYEESVGHAVKLQNTTVLCEHLCFYVGLGLGLVFWSPVCWMRPHSGLEGGKKSLCYEVSRPVDTREMPRPTVTQAGTPPTAPTSMILNCTIVLSDSILPGLVRHHLLSPQKAL